MSSAVTEAATWETSVIGPDGTDLISAAGVRTGLQDVANRTKWLKESFAAGATKTVDIVGNNVGETTSFATVNYGGITADFALTLSIGDIVLLFAHGGSVNFAAQNYGFSTRWYDSVAAASISEQYTNKGAAWTANESVPIDLSAAHVCTVAGARTFSFQAKCDNVLLVPSGDGKLQVSYLHLKLGA